MSDHYLLDEQVMEQMLKALREKLNGRVISYEAGGRIADGWTQDGIEVKEFAGARHLSGDEFFMHWALPSMAVLADYMPKDKGIVFSGLRPVLQSKEGRSGDVVLRMVQLGSAMRFDILYKEIS